MCEERVCVCVIQETWLVHMRREGVCVCVCNIGNMLVHV